MPTPKSKPSVTKYSDQSRQRIQNQVVCISSSAPARRPASLLRSRARVGRVEPRIAAHQPEVDDRRAPGRAPMNTREAERHLRRRRRRRDRVGRLLQPPDDPGLAAGLGQDPAAEAGEERQRDPAHRGPLEPLRLRRCHGARAASRPRARAAASARRGTPSRACTSRRARPSACSCPGPNCAASCAWFSFRPTTLPWNEPVARYDSSPGISIEKLGVWSLLREAADLEDRERRRLLGVPERLGRGDLHRLDVRRLRSRTRSPTRAGTRSAAPSARSRASPPRGRRRRCGPAAGARRRRRARRSRPSGSRPGSRARRRRSRTSGTRSSPMSFACAVPSTC